jgi:hypothetical protein
MKKSRPGTASRLFPGDAFTYDEFINDIEYKEDIPHEFIHGGKIGNEYQIYVFGKAPVGHDLLGYKYYGDIIKSCQR